MLEDFNLTSPLWKTALWATTVYCAVFLLLRLLTKPTMGKFSLEGMLTLIVIDSIAKTSIVGGSTSVADIILMIAFVLLWNFIINSLEYYFPFFRYILRDRHAILILDNRHLMRENMQREMVSKEELSAAIREKNVKDFSIFILPALRPMVISELLKRSAGINPYRELVCPEYIR